MNLAFKPFVTFHESDDSIAELDSLTYLIIYCRIILFEITFGNVKKVMEKVICYHKKSWNSVKKILWEPWICV